MARLFPRTLIIFLLMVVSGCGTLIPPTAATPPESITVSPITPVIKTATIPAINSPKVLRIWLPTQFDPESDNATARLLKARLDLFVITHPGILLDVRIKNETGPASLLESLSLARVAAPETLPDLIALSRKDLEDAALKGGIHPIEGLTDVLDDPGWYSYARQLGYVQNSAYGLCFAGDALLLAYNPKKYAHPPENWDAILSRPGVLPLSGEMPQVLLFVSLYRSINGGLLDAQNHPMLEEFALGPSLSILDRARKTGTLFAAGEEAAWQSFLEGRAAWTVTTATRVLADPSEGYQIAPLPGLNEDPFTLGTCWAWALAGSDPQNEALAIKLAEWLIKDEYLNAWVNQAGYLPTRSADVSDRFPALSNVAESAQPVPSNDPLAALEPVLQDAVRRILNGEPVESVTQAAVEALK